MRVIGTAVGTIIPTIITAHIKNIRRKSSPLQGRILIISPAVMDMSSMLKAMTMRYTQASKVIPKREARMAIRLRRGSERVRGAAWAGEPIGIPEECDT